MNGGSGPKLVHITTIAGTQYHFMRGQNAYLRVRGFELHSVASPGERLHHLAERDNVATHAVPIERTIQPLADLVSLYNLWRLLCQLCPDICVVSTPKAALIGAIAAWLARVPVRIFLVRGSITENAKGVRRYLFRFLERFTASLCNQVICIAPSLLDFARRERIVSSRKGMIMANGMSNGIDAQRFDPDRPEIGAQAASLRQELAIAEDTCIIGFVGRLCADKGLEDLVCAWQTLRSHPEKPILLIVGGWEEEDPISPDARELLLSDDRIILTGSTEDVVPYYRLMTVLAFPTRGTEGFPNVPMEAAAMQLPVVATRTIGCVDAVVDGVTGTLVPPRDPKALAEAIARYLDDPDLCRRHGQAGRERVLRDFRSEDIWEATYQEYVQLLQEKGLPIPASAEARP